VPANPSGTSPARTALVVDDSMLIRHTICRWLEERGFQVASASNGVEALRCLLDHLPEVIITDLQMPKMNGRELIATLQGQPSTRQIPIIVLSSRPQSATEVVCEHPHIFKDIDIEVQLGRVLGELLGNLLEPAGR
jgi:CheY-like chemotaxis protein